MNVQDLADRLAEAHSLSKSDARAVIGTMMEAIAAAARAGDEVAVPGFGKFKVRERKAREARNPQTGETVKVPAQRKLAFLPAKALKDSLNPGAAGKSAAKGAGKNPGKSQGKSPSAKKGPAKSAGARARATA